MSAKIAGTFIAQMAIRQLWKVVSTVWICSPGPDAQAQASVGFIMLLTVYCGLLFICCLETGSPVAHTDLQLAVQLNCQSLSAPPKCWHCGHTPPYPVVMPVKKKKLMNCLFFEFSV